MSCPVEQSLRCDLLKLNLTDPRDLPATRRANLRPLPCAVGRRKAEGKSSTSVALARTFETGECAVVNACVDRWSLVLWHCACVRSKTQKKKKKIASTVLYVEEQRMFNFDSAALYVKVHGTPENKIFQSAVLYVEEQRWYHNKHMCMVLGKFQSTVLYVEEQRNER